GLGLVGIAEPGSAGLLLDIWHVVRGGIGFEQIAAVPGELIAAVELNDGANSVGGTLWDDAIENRRLWGGGEFDHPAFLRAVLQAGYSGPYGVEIMGAEYRRRPLDEAAGSVYRSTSQQFTLLHGTPG